MIVPRTLGRRNKNQPPPMMTMIVAASAAVCAAQEIRKRKEAEHDWIEFGIEVAQHRAKLRQHESEEKDQHGACRDQDEGGIPQGVAEAPAQRLGPDPLGTEHLEDSDQSAGGLANPHQHDIHRWK